MKKILFVLVLVLVLSYGSKVFADTRYNLDEDGFVNLVFSCTPGETVLLFDKDNVFVSKIICQRESENQWSLYLGEAHGDYSLMETTFIGDPILLENIFIGNFGSK